MSSGMSSAPVRSLRPAGRLFHQRCASKMGGESSQLSIKRWDRERPCTRLRLNFPRVIRAVSSGKADLPHKRPLCYRCYLPVLAGFAEGSSRRAQTINTTCPDTVRKKGSLGREFDPTVADRGLQGTASSPSSTVKKFIGNAQSISYSKRTVPILP
jgi:hypothetical protein